MAWGGDGALANDVGYLDLDVGKRGESMPFNQPGEIYINLPFSFMLTFNKLACKANSLFGRE